MHLRLALSLVLIFGLAAARPFGNPEVYMAPSSLPFICKHVLYWFRHACFVMGPSHTSHIAGDATHFTNGFASSGFSWQFGPGLFGPLGWGENDITIIDRNPPVSYASRTAAFGPRITQTPGLLGYVIPLSSFMYPCDQNISRASPYPHIFTGVAEPINFGCPDLCPLGADRRPDQSETWIALIQRGNCSFTAKVREAEKLGARAVVVGGDAEGGDELITMYSPDPSDDIAIPATYITHASYASLLSVIQASNTTVSGLKTVSLLLSSDEIWQWPLLTLSILLLLPSIMTLTTLLVHRIRQARAERLERAPEDIVYSLPSGVWTNEGLEFDDAVKEIGIIAHQPYVSIYEDSLPSLSVENTTDHEGQARELKMRASHDMGGQAQKAPLNSDHTSLPDEGGAETSSALAVVGASQRRAPGCGCGRRYLKKAWFSNQSECAICLSDFEKGDPVRILPCGHIFHREEVDTWLIQRKKLCPVCKADITMASKPPSMRSPSPVLLASVPRHIDNDGESDFDPREASSSVTSSASASTSGAPPNERTPLLNQRI